MPVPTRLTNEDRTLRLAESPESKMQKIQNQMMGNAT